jgi:hypothetical protein
MEFIIEILLANVLLFPVSFHGEFCSATSQVSLKEIEIPRPQFAGLRAPATMILGRNMNEQQVEKLLRATEVSLPYLPNLSQAVVFYRCDLFPNQIVRVTYEIDGKRRPSEPTDDLLFFGK